METEETIFDLTTFSSIEQNSTEYVYKLCSEEFGEFWYNLDIYITNLNLALCILGISFNILSMIVFSRKRMVNPTNTILAGISMVDIIVMSVYILQYFATLQKVKENSPYSVAVIWIIHEFFLASFHSISMWLNMTLAIWRYIAVVFPLKSRSLCTMRRIKIVMTFIFVTCILVTLGGYYTARIVEADPGKTWKDTTDGEYGRGCGAKYCDKWTTFDVLRLIEFINSGFLSKVVPALVLIFVSIRLIKALVDARANRKRMNSVNNTTGRKESVAGNAAALEAEQEFDRTTRMLLVILIIFLLTELPPSILYLLTLVYHLDFYFECRKPLHYFILNMYFLSGNFNFVVYVVMSKNFRRTLVDVLCLRRVQKFFGRDVPIDKNVSSTGSTKTVDSRV